uniref:DNA recombinase n=1 Tax=uncultured Bacillota bacterium TaxID=344338 RepID=A0A650ENQ4_9FIRM|nr:DNA recombinase [uncultured Firmicutes bacterium]
MHRTLWTFLLGGIFIEHKTFYYARVSSREQNLDRQIEAFRKLGADEREIICDKESGKDLERSGYQALKHTMLRSGDTLVVKSLDRLSRNKADIKNELQYFKDNNIRLKVIDLPTTMMDLPEGQEWVFDMVNNILIEVLGTIAEQERETIRKRQREGIEAARANGKHLGRPSVVKPDNYDEVVEKWQAKEITARQAMKLLGISKSVFYRWVQQK